MGHHDPAQLLRQLEKSDRRRRRARLHSGRRGRTTPEFRRGEPTSGGTVVAVHRSAVDVCLADGTVIECQVDHRLRRQKESGVVVGDRVTVALEHAVIRRIHPRSTRLARHDVTRARRQLVICANIDRVLVVAAFRDPPLRPRLIDRYLIAVAAGGALPTLVLTKLDKVVDRDEVLAPVAPYAPWLPTFAVSCVSGEGIEELRAAIAGETVVTVGHSGVGKSSLVNALGGTARIGDVTEHGRGRHTTTSSLLHELPGQIRVVDTPGVRQFAPWGLDKATLGAAFPDVCDLARGCRFASCTHCGEEGCALPPAVDEGTLAPLRLDSWRRLQSAL